jgi:hypothetical protein
MSFGISVIASHHSVSYCDNSDGIAMIEKSRYLLPTAYTPGSEVHYTSGGKAAEAWSWPLTSIKIRR